MVKRFDKVYYVNINDESKSDKLVYALNCKTRRDILRLLSCEILTIQTIAERLNVSISTISEHVSVLVKSGLVSICKKDGADRLGKYVVRQYERIEIGMLNESNGKIDSDSVVYHIPIGSYSSFNVKQYCGMVREEGYIEGRDDPDIFYSPLRSYAQLIWFDEGYLEYTVSLHDIDLKNIDNISLSLELCSEAPGYNENWKSDIFFSFNDIDVCTYVSPGDFGARHGVLTPSWWAEGANTQYGLLKNISVDGSGTFIDGEKVSPITIDDIGVKNNKIFKFAFGVKPNAKNRGGINVFGSKFGDYRQHIILTVSYKKAETTK